MGAYYRNPTMILEVAVLDVIPTETAAFEQAFQQAQAILVAAQGYRGHELRRCLETPARYLLLVYWQTLVDHTEGFRGSAAYQDWKALLHHYYDPFPTVEHYPAAIAAGSASQR
jgi:heme-degrading monooxygenase HmoA